MQYRKNDMLEIIRRNFATPVVFSIYALALLLLFVQEFRDAWFISFVITINTLFAVVQEIRAQRVLKKLELLNAPQARLLKSDNTTTVIDAKELKVGDTIELRIGDDIPADGTIIKSDGLELNESLLTGESNNIQRSVDDTVYAASAVAAGSATVKVTAVGEHTKTGKMTSTLRRYKPELTPLQRLIARLITTLTWSALVIGAIITIVYWLDGQTARTILKTITSAGIAIIPEGLILASTLLLAFGSLRLAQAKVLPQKLSAIEGMALLDILCVDKTGTLTSEAICYEKTEQFVDFSQKKVLDILGTACHAMGGGTPTSDELLRAIPSAKNSKTINVLPFSSERKLSGATVTVDTTTYSVLLGAPEYVAQYAPLTKKQKSIIDQHTAQGKRVLLAAYDFNTEIPLADLKHASGKPFGIVILTNSLRDGVKETVNFLQDNGVEIRVISGDNPKTVQYVAKSAGINGYTKCITGAQLDVVADEAWDDVVVSNRLFTRVLPEQKERIIATLKSHGNYTGMVGDGVNDALAIKESNLGVAMHSGSAATRRVADLVLLSNSFTSMPMGMRLGNKIMQAIEAISMLFFHKIIYGVTVLFLTMSMGLIYPFDPRHNTFMNIFMVTLPTIMWTLFPPKPLAKINPKNYWQDTLVSVIPIALLSGVGVTAVYATSANILSLDRPLSSTLTVIVATLFGLNMVFLASRMTAAATTWRTVASQIGLLMVASIVIAASFSLQTARDFFDFSLLGTVPLTDLWPIGVMLLFIIVTQHSIAYFAQMRIKNRLNT